jgi:hypothetical protein
VRIRSTPPYAARRPAKQTLRQLAEQVKLQSASKTACALPKSPAPIVKTPTTGIVHPEARPHSVRLHSLHSREHAQFISAQDHVSTQRWQRATSFPSNSACPCTPSVSTRVRPPAAQRSAAPRKGSLLPSAELPYLRLVSPMHFRSTVPLPSLCKTLLALLLHREPSCSRPARRTARLLPGLVLRRSTGPCETRQLTFATQST